MPHEGILFILIGPSGSGKNTLMRRVQTLIDDLPQLPTYTTRRIRPGEQEGREHYFVSRTRFKDRIVHNALVEHQKVHMGDFYGVPRHDVEAAIQANRDLIADIDFLGARRVQTAYPAHTVLIFVTPSSLDTLDERIKRRGDISEAELANRLARTRFEMTFAPQCDYVILNDLLDPAVEHLRQIIHSERVRRRGVHQHDQPVIEPPRQHRAAVAVIVHENQVLAAANASGALPTFALEDHDGQPPDVLQREVQRTLGCEITIDTLSDTRFDFAAPHYVTLGAIPYDIYLYYYYQCTLVSPLPATLVGWCWQPPAETLLPAALQTRIQA